MAAGGDDELVFSRGDHALIFGLDDLGAPGSFLHIGKAQFEKCLTHAVQTAHAEVGNKGGRQADNHRTARGDQSPGLIGIPADLLGALGAGDIAVSAVDTLPLDNLCPVFGKPDGFQCAFPDAFITAFTILFFEEQQFTHLSALPVSRFQIFHRSFPHSRR